MESNKTHTENHFMIPSLMVDLEDISDQGEMNPMDEFSTINFMCMDIATSGSSAAIGRNQFDKPIAIAA